MNYYLGRWVDRHEEVNRRKVAVGVAVAFNVGLLAFFKYADFVVSTLNSVVHLAGINPFPQPHIPLPIGISFFTFPRDLIRGGHLPAKWPAAKDIRDTALYIFFFPQLIAGPILRWSAIAPQLLQRQMSRDEFAEGVRRFVGGLSKKMIIANALALPGWTRSSRCRPMNCRHRWRGLGSSATRCRSTLISQGTRHGGGDGQDVRVQVPRKLQLPLPRPVHPRILATLAYLTFDVVP
ncbi:MAG: hypothetical protein WDN00_12040 [Limisphaerales bacterium]